MGSNRLADLEVEVRVDGQWWPGWLDPDDRRQVGGRWAALVRWSKGTADNRLKSFDQDVIRRVESWAAGMDGAAGDVVHRRPSGSPRPRPRRSSA